MIELIYIFGSLAHNHVAVIVLRKTLIQRIMVPVDVDLEVFEASSAKAELACSLIHVPRLYAGALAAAAIITEDLTLSCRGQVA